LEEVDSGIPKIDKHLENVQKTHSEYYVAPELFKGDWTTKIDEWAVGVITYQLLTGQLPFQSEIVPETFKLIQTNKFGNHQSELEFVSEEGRDFIQKLLTYDPSKRLSAA
jgi:calcium-dependent protein kinase